MKLPAAKDVHFDIDDYLNRFVPRSRLDRLPKPLSRFLGYRDAAEPPVGNILIATWALVGAFCGLTVVTAVYKFSPGISQYHPPVIVASLGAAAILNYNVILSPLAQPRNAIVGNTLSAIVGVSITKLFMLSPSSFDDHRWLAGPLCCGAASWAMTMTNTVFPPGGATAVLAATDPTVGAMGWVFVPVVLLGSVLMLAVALLTNNVQRQYPAFWWTPRDVGRRRRGADIESASRRGEDDEKRSGRTRSSTTAEADRDRGNDDLSADDEASRDRKIVITERRVLIPDSFSLGPVESQWVEMLRDRLRSEARCYNPSEASLDQDSTGTLHSSRDMLPSLKSQKSQGDA